MGEYLGVGVDSRLGSNLVANVTHKVAQRDLDDDIASL
jgi:hypothetical protein